MSERKVIATRRAAAEHALGQLLAIIHRDGGQHHAAVGTAQAVADAHQRWAALMVRAEAAEARVAELAAEVERLRAALRRHLIWLGVEDQAIDRAIATLEAGR